MDPQENAAVLIWSSSDEVSDEDPKKIGKLDNLLVTILNKDL